MRWKGRIAPPRVASGGRSILYVGLAMSHTLGDFAATKAKHWCIGSLAHAGGQQHRGHGGSAIGIDGLVYAQKTDPKVDYVIIVTLVAIRRSET